MLGERSPQGSLFVAETQYLEFVGRESFYGFWARHGRELFRNADSAGFYCAENGRRSVPPSQLATALLLRTHDHAAPGRRGPAGGAGLRTDGLLP